MERSNVGTFQVERKYIFVDWAGDPGFRFRAGSSRHFIVVAVFTSDYGLIQQKLALLRQQRQMSPDFHFHYADAPRRVAQAFFEAVRDVPFSARVTVVDKAVLPDTWRRMPGQWMVEHFIARTIMGARAAWVEDAVLIFDGSRRETKTIHGIRAAISHLFAERGLAYRLKKVTARPAVEEAGLQMADMIAGAALDDAGGRSRSYLPQLGNSLELVYVSEEENRPG